MSAERLRDILTTRGDLLNDETLTEKRRVPSTGSSATTSEAGSVVVHGDQQKEQQQQQQQREQPLRIRTKNLSGDDDNEDDFNDYVIEPPRPPPTELHPDKLYALYEFNGDDPSHCELEREDSVTLLNDQDSYWWLVRKDKDSKIGFAPAECLETYDERLARLNCWKNEELERTSRDIRNESSPTSDIKIEKLLNKSVTFSEEVTITEPIDMNHSSAEEDHQPLLIDDDDDDDDDDTDEYFENQRQNIQKEVEDDDDEENDDDDDRMEANSDALGSDFLVPPLILKKNKKHNNNNNDNNNSNNKAQPQHMARMFEESDAEESPFIQPQAFFTNYNGSGSIGTYSPSSSEFESPGNTPPLNQYRRKPVLRDDSLQQSQSPEERRGNIPQSKGTRDIAKSMQMLDELINDEMNTTTSLSEGGQPSPSHSEGEITLTYDDDDEHKLSSPISLTGDNCKSLSATTTSTTFSNSNVSLQPVTSGSVDSSIERFHEDKVVHPAIEALFKDSLGKMDELSRKLRELDLQFGRS